MTDAAPLIQVVLWAALGLVAGRILGRVSLRLPAGEGRVLGRSHCGGCGRAASAWGLIPLLGYAVARRCGGCGASIPVRQPLMETAGALIGVWAALAQTSPVAAALTAALGWQLLLIAVIDGEHFWLPDVLTLPLLATGLLAAAVLERLVVIDAVIGAGVGFTALWLIGRLYRRLRGREGLGGGDPYLLAAGGGWVGWIGLPSVLLWAATAGLSVVAARILLGREVSGHDRAPFGVYLAVGIWLTWLLGPLGMPR